MSESEAPDNTSSQKLKEEVEKLTRELERVTRIRELEKERREAADNKVQNLESQLERVSQESLRKQDLIRSLREKCLKTLDERDTLAEEATELRAVRNYPNTPISANTRNAFCQTNLTLIVTDVYPYPDPLYSQPPLDLPPTRFCDKRSITSSAFPRFHPRDYDPAASEYSGPLPSRRNAEPKPSTSRENPSPTSSSRSNTDYSRYDYPPAREVSIQNTNYVEDSAQPIPSLLSLNVPIPDDIDPATVEFLRRPNRPGCWNCDNPTHHYHQCWQPPLRRFCMRCGEPNFTVNNCPECIRLHRIVKELHDSPPPTS